jgi:hypothetical protein
MKVKGTALLAGAAAGLIALTLTSTPSDARWGGGWRGGGWRGAAWRGGWGPGWRGGWRYGGWRYGGWRPGLALGAAAVGLGVGLAASSAWGYPGYGYGYGYGYPGYYGAYSGCLRQVWYAGAWRLVNVC